jgi:DNA-binding FadR family transcriptional regulator
MADKVFGGQLKRNGRRARTIVAAPSQKKAAEYLGVSLSYLRENISVSDNENEVKVAMKNPGVVLQETEEGGKKFLPLEKGIFK